MACSLRRRTCSWLALTVAGALLVLPAVAQDSATADALFQKGLADMQAGKYETGCPAIRESYRLDPRLGALFTLAECEAKAGLVASASAHYDDYLRRYARLTPDEQRRQLGREKISAAQKEALAPQIPYLTIALAPTAPKGARVRRDQIDLADPSLGLPLPVDPGEHVITVTAPDGRVSEKRITIDKGEKKSIEVDVVGQAPPTSPGPAPTTTPTTPPPRPTPTTPPVAPGSGMSGQRIGAFVAGGVGVVGLGVGAVTGALVLGKKSTIEGNCDGVDCNPEGLSAAEAAQTLGLVSTIGFGVGLAGVALGAVLFLTEPSPTTMGAPRRGVRPGFVALGPDHALIGVGGSF